MEVDRYAPEFSHAFYRIDRFFQMRRIGGIERYVRVEARVRTGGNRCEKFRECAVPPYPVVDFGRAVDAYPESIDIEVEGERTVRDCSHPEESAFSRGLYDIVRTQ